MKLKKTYVVDSPSIIGFNGKFIEVRDHMPVQTIDIVEEVSLLQYLKIKLLGRS